jgi:hypothetical protein
MMFPVRPAKHVETGFDFSYSLRHSLAVYAEQA